MSRHGRLKRYPNPHVPCIPRAGFRGAEERISVAGDMCLVGRWRKGEAHIEVIG